MAGLDLKLSEGRMSSRGRERLVATGNFVAPEIQWLLGGSEPEGINSGAVPLGGCRGKWNRPLAPCVQNSESAIR